jgi:hypothetical protein
MTVKKPTLYKGYYRKDGYGITYTYNHDGISMYNEIEIKKEKLNK